MKVHKYYIGLFLVTILVVILIFFGALLRQHYLQVNNEKFILIKKIAVLFAEIPYNAKRIIKHRNLEFDAAPKLYKHKKKERFIRYIKKDRDALIVLPRYDHSIGRAFVEIIDLNNFEVIHTYKVNSSKLNNLVTNTDLYPRLKIHDKPSRFEYGNPLILNDGSMISFSRGPAFKIDICSNIKWINDNERFHHSLNFDHNGDIWVPGRLKPHSEYVKRLNLIIFADDSIIKMDQNGKILLNKSVIEILIENKIFDDNHYKKFRNSGDPIHLNDIEPVLFDSEYFKKGDIFLSIRDQSAIMHYRPETNKIINYIKGPFAMNHDVDIISNKEISIFNNNNFVIDNEFSNVLIYNFETKKFKKLFDINLKKDNFKTETNGQSEILDDFSLIVNENNHGRIILYNSFGKKEWEFVNKDINDDIGYTGWIRIIEDKSFIKKFKLLIKNKKCLN